MKESPQSLAHAPPPFQSEILAHITRKKDSPSQPGLFLDDPRLSSTLRRFEEKPHGGRVIEALAEIEND
jgi:hypothetical protein